jgi:3-oxoacyl-[acyl-carrier protein] reductase
MKPAAATDLTGLTAVVTGSSRGIGRAIALELAEAGAAIVVHGRSGGGSEETARRITAQGGSALVVLADVGLATDRARLVDSAFAWRGTVDVWINNAGADILTGPPASESFEAKLDRLWNVDVQATIDLGRNVGARMKAAGRGVILNVGWDQAETGMAGESGQLFAAAKGAIMAFSKSLARSLAPEVRVNCLAPGWIRTAWGDRAADYWQQRAKEESLLHRWGSPEDVARVARFLVSPAASFVNAQVVPVNGGLRRTS